MNKKGFTLIEILAVIVILSLIITIVATNGFGAFNNTKDKISEQSMVEIIQSAKVFMTDVQHCDDEINEDIVNKVLGEEYDCEDLKDKAKGNIESDTCITLKLSDLRDLGYISGNNVNEEIKKDSNFTIKTCIVDEKIELGVMCTTCNEDNFKNITEDVEFIDTDSVSNAFNNKTLAYQIIDNAIEERNGTSFSSNVNLNTQYNSDDLKKVISTAEDDYGNSYYFRGDITNNYINFANMCWRIVRIAGDGSIKLILEDQNEECSENMDGSWDIPTSTELGSNRYGNFGYTHKDNNVIVMNYLNIDGKAENYEHSMATAFKNFQTTKLSSYYSSLKPGDWCIDDSEAYAYDCSNGCNNDEAPNKLLTKSEIKDIQDGKLIEFYSEYYYDSYIRTNYNYNPTLKCRGNNMEIFGDNTKMYVGTLTGDELVLAGISVNSTTKNDNYLTNNYQKNNHVGWRTLTPSGFFSGDPEYTMIVTYGGYLTDVQVDYESNTGNADSYVIYSSTGSAAFRPSISLKSDIKYQSGDGTVKSPYKVE